MRSKGSVLAVGDINLDIIAPVPFYPHKGGEGVTARAEVHLGGSATNTAVVLARFGIKTYLLGRVGADPFGDYAVSLLEKTRVDISLVQRDSELLTGIMFIAVTPDGDRTIFGQRGANVNLKPISLRDAGLCELEWIHISGYSFLQEPQRSTALEILKEASEMGISVSLDVGMCAAFQAQKEIEKALPMLHVLLLSLEEARALTGEEKPEKAIEYVLSRGPKKVAVKMGGKGCLVSDGRKLKALGALPIKVVDTTGAGDAFNAGFILGELFGRGIEESGFLGNILGAMACATMGAGERLPGPEELASFLEAQPMDPDIKGWLSSLTVGVINDKI